MVEFRIFPVFFVMAFFALIAFLTFMFVVFLVAGDALGLQRGLGVHDALVASIALDFVVFAFERVFRFA